MSATEDGRSNFVTTVYDSFGRVAATENQLGFFTSTIYDSLGRVAATENALGNYTSTLYDAYGRPAGTEDPLGHISTTIYDSYGRQVATQDPLGHLTTSVLDSLGRHSLEFRLSGSEAQEQSVALGDWGSDMPIVAVERVQAFLTGADAAARAVPAIGGIEVHTELAAGKVLCRERLSDFQPTDLVVVRVELAIYTSGGAS